MLVQVSKELLQAKVPLCAKKAREHRSSAFWRDWIEFLSTLQRCSKSVCTKELTSHWYTRDSCKHEIPQNTGRYRQVSQFACGRWHFSFKKYTLV